MVIDRRARRPSFDSFAGLHLDEDQRLAVERDDIVLRIGRAKVTRKDQVAAASQIAPRDRLASRPEGKLAPPRHLLVPAIEEFNDDHVRRADPITDMRCGVHRLSIDRTNLSSRTELAKLPKRQRRRLAAILRASSERRQRYRQRVIDRDAGTIGGLKEADTVGGANQIGAIEKVEQRDAVGELSGITMSRAALRLNCYTLGG